MKLPIAIKNATASDAAADKIATVRWENEGGHTIENEEKPMSCCKDVMKPIEASSCCIKWPPLSRPFFASNKLRSNGVEVLEFRATTSSRP